MVTWVLYLCIGVLIGGMAGFYFAKMDDLSKKQKQALEDKIKQSEKELLDYKDQVTGHFRETAALVNNMTESYQKVHEHLATGASNLCNTEIEVNRLEVNSKDASKIAPPLSDAKITKTKATETKTSDTNTAETRNTNSTDNATSADVDSKRMDANPAEVNGPHGDEQLLPEDSTMTDGKEAPKTSTLSNANNNNNATSEIEDEPEANADADAINQASVVIADGTSTSGNLNSQNVELTSPEHSTNQESTQNQDNKSSNKASTEPSSTITPTLTPTIVTPDIIETMAVAEDISDEPTSGDDNISAPTSRMVH